MILQYNELAADLERIRRFLTSGSEDWRTPDQRRFAYIACISALYSSFENFAERVVFRFSQMMLVGPTKLSADQLAGLRRRYVRNASALLAQSLGVGRYREMTELDVAKSLASCLEGATSPVDLRLELVALHTSNLRWESLAELFHWAAPDLLSSVRRSDAVEMWVSRAVDVSDDTLMAVLKNELDDLVERRNEVAHRAIPDEILSFERLLAKVTYIEAISLGLVASLAGLFLKASVASGECASLGTPTEYFRKNRVVVVPSLESAVSEGDAIVAPGGNRARWGRVLEIQLADARVERAHAGDEAGLLLDFAAPKGAKLHVWRDPSPDLVFRPDGIFGGQGPLELN